MKRLLLTAFIGLTLVGCDGNDTPAQVQNTNTVPSAQVVQGQPDAQPQQVVQSVPQQQPQQPTVVYETAPQQQPTTVVVQQQPQYDSTGHLLNTMMTMHMMNHIMGGGSYSRPRVVHNTTVINRTVVRPSRSYYGSRSFSSSRSSFGRSRSSFRRR